MGTGSSAIEKTKQLGNQYFAKGDYKKALSAYSKALRYDPTNHVLLSNRSACNLKLLDFKDALEDALACVAASPQWNKGYFRVASTLQVCGLQSESLYYYSISLSISADALTVSKCEELSKLVKFKGRNTVLIWGVAQPRPMSLKALEGLQVAEIACGINHCLAVCLTGHVYAWGDNTYNQCGVIGNCSEPKMITELLGLNVNAVLCGGGHSIAICSTGDIYAWGINSYGQCGYSGNDQKIQKVIVPGKVKGGSAGLGHTFLLSDNGEVYASGWNSHGQLGIPNKDFLYQFTKIDIKSANYISCGAVHSLVVLTSGDVLSTGGNSCGQLGLGHFANVNIFTIVPGLKDISICCCGEEFSVAVSTRCQVYTFGLGNVGQLGYEGEMSNSAKIVEKMPGILGTEYIACTKSTVLAVTRNFSTYSWGLIPDYTSLNSSLSLPVQITTLKSKRVREIKCLRDSFVICSDHVIPNSYITNIPLGTIDAGKKHVMNLNLIDSNLMFINDPLDKIGVLAFNSNGGISKGEISAYWDNSKHIIEAKLTGAGHHTIYVFCNSLQLKNSPFIYTVGHGNFTYCKGFVSSESLLINAGVGFVMLIKAYDRFDNLVTNDPELVFSSSVDGRCEIIDFEEGCYRVVVYCTEIGKHEMVMKCNGRAFEIVLQDFTRAEPVEVKVQGFVNVQVLPGIISPSHCTVEGLKHEYIAGEVISFFIVSRDQYNNTTWHRSKPWCIDSALSFSLQESADYCSTYITAVSLKSCKIPLKLSYDNHNLISTEIHIIPGPMHLPFTVVNKCGNPIFTEKSTREILIEFYDQYCNPCPYSPNVKSPCKFTIKNYEFYKCSIEYYVEIPGVYSFHIETDQGPLEIKVVHDKDPQVLQREQYEKARLEWELQKIAEEEEKKQQAEQKLRETQESQRKLLLKEKQKAVEALEKQQKIMESEELDRRLRVIARIKAQEVTKKRGLDALLKLEEEKKQKVQKKWKRIGGGFTVPFITDE